MLKGSPPALLPLLLLRASRGLIFKSLHQNERSVTRENACVCTAADEATATYGLRSNHPES